MKMEVTSSIEKERCSLALQVQVEGAQCKYLDIPTFVGKSKTNLFGCVKDRVWMKVQGWNEKFLSSGGKALLIKAVAQSIPTYAMSCFALPQTLCDEVSKVIRDFWWRTKNGKHKIH